MEYMESAMQSYFENMEHQREDVWDEAKEKAREHLFNAQMNSELLPEKNGNPYVEGEWQYEEWEASYEHYIMSGLGY
jgi:hypothetical protein